MKKVLKFLLWPFQALLRPAAQSVRSLRLSLYLCAAIGLLGALPAAAWCMAHLVKLLPSLKRAVKEPSEAVVVLIMVGAVLPFVLAAVLQWASAFRVLRKLPDDLRLNMPGLGAMNAVAPVAYLVMATVAAVVVLNVGALVLTLVGFFVAFALSGLYSVFDVLTLDNLDPNVGICDRIKQIFDICTSSRHFFELQRWLVEAIDPPDWVITLLVVMAYAIPTVFAIAVWASRHRLVAGATTMTFAGAQPSPPGPTTHLQGPGGRG